MNSWCSRFAGCLSRFNRFFGCALYQTVQGFGRNDSVLQMRPGSEKGLRWAGNGGNKAQIGGMSRPRPDKLPNPGLAEYPRSKKYSPRRTRSSRRSSKTGVIRGSGIANVQHSFGKLRIIEHSTSNVENGAAAQWCLAGPSVRKCKGQKLEFKVVEPPSAELICGSLRSLALGRDDVAALGMTVW